MIDTTTPTTPTPVVQPTPQQETKSDKHQSFLDKCFNKKNLITKGIIAGIAFILMLAFCLSFYLWLKDKPVGIVGKENGFWYIEIVWNRGIGWSALSGNYTAIYIIQSLVFIVLLAIYIFVTHDRITCSFVALAMFGGLFNLIQRGASGNNCVLDYFTFGFWKGFPTFNWPDMFVVIGIFGFVISYIVLLIIQSVKDNQ